MTVKKAIHQLSLVELLIERDKAVRFRAYRSENPRLDKYKNPILFVFKSMFSTEVIPSNSNFDLESIELELEKRSPDDNERQEAERVKKEIQKIRNEKASKELSLFMKVVIFIIPEIVFSKKKDSGPSKAAWEDEDSFLEEAGFQKIAKQRFRIAVFGMAFRFIVLIILFLIRTI